MARIAEFGGRDSERPESLTEDNKRDEDDRHQDRDAANEFDVVHREIPEDTVLREPRKTNEQPENDCDHESAKRHQQRDGQPTDDEGEAVPPNLLCRDLERYSGDGRDDADQPPGETAERPAIRSARWRRIYG